MIPTAASVRTAVMIPLRFADGYTTQARVLTFDGLIDGREHLALALGDRADLAEVPCTVNEPPLVRLHSECLTGDVFGSQRCACGAQLRESVERIATVGGFLLYLRQEGRGIGLYPKIDAYLLQDAGLDTYEANIALGFEADARDYTVAAQMLRAMGEPEVVLLSNNPDKAEQLEGHGVRVVRRRRTGVHLSRPTVATLRPRPLSAPTRWTSRPLEPTRPGTPRCDLRGGGTAHKPGGHPDTAAVERAATRGRRGQAFWVSGDELVQHQEH